MSDNNIRFSRRKFLQTSALTTAASGTLALGGAKIEAAWARYRAR